MKKKVKVTKHIPADARGLLHQWHGADSGGLLGEVLSDSHQAPLPPTRLCPLCSDSADVRLATGGVSSHVNTGDV